MKNKMSTLVLLSVIFFSCSNNNEEATKKLEKDVYSSLLNHVKSELQKDESMKNVKLDSLIIVKIDTLTAVSKAKSLKEILSSILPNADDNIKASKEGLIAQTKGDAYAEMAGVKNDRQFDENDLTDAINLKQALLNSIDSCQKIIDNPKSDNTTLTRYLIKYKLIVSNSEKKATIDAPDVEMTKELKVLQNLY